MGKPEVLEASTKNPNNQKFSSDNSCGLTSDFWKNFAESIWEKKTFVKRKNFVTPPISEEELFNCVVDMSIKHSEAYEAGLDTNDVSIYVKGIEVKENYAHLFPKLSDRDFSGYSKRVSKELEGQPFAFVIDEMTMPENLKVWTHSFLKGLYGPLEAISQGSFWSIFFGDYSTTPYGVHDHSNSLYSECAFYFPIVGEKEMTIWRPSYVRENPDLKGTHNYTKYLEGSTRLSAEPGGMMYWPSDRWHVGSSGGGDVSIVLAVKGFSDVYIEFLLSITGLAMLASYKPSGMRKWLGTFTECLLLLKHVALVKFSARARSNQVRNLPFDVNDLQASAEVIPEALQKFGRRMNIRFYFGENIEKALSVFWLFYLTNLGAESRNDPFPPIKLLPELRIRRSPEIVLLWRKVDSETLLLVADRYAHEIPLLFLPLVKNIADTEAGQEIVHDNLVDLVSGLGISSQEAEEELGRLLRFLGESGAFRSQFVMAH